MTSPYIPLPLDAFMAAQTSAGLVLAACLWRRLMRPVVATWLMLLAIALAVLAPTIGDFGQGIGLTVTPVSVKSILKLSAAAATLAALLTRRPLLVIVAAGAEPLLWWLTDFIQECDNELAAVHAAYCGLLIGLHWRAQSVTVSAPSPQPFERLGRAWVDDIVAAAGTTLLAALACVVLLHRWTDSGDEWAYTYQAAVFAKLHAYAAIPRCGDAFRSFWVFHYMGRSFAQYTPGWPYFMTPFVLVGKPWLAGPVSLGLLGAATSRLGRRAAAGYSGDGGAPSTAFVRAAGRFSALLVPLGTMILVNGASRYPHIFVAAMFAWSIEALFTIASPGQTRRRQWAWGLVFGVASALLLATRPGDGATLGVGLFIYAAYALVRGRLPWRSVVGGALGFAPIAVLTLVILRLQLGKWFTTGYSLTESIYGSGFAASWSAPKANEYRWGLPFMTGAFCWWPCAPALGLAGLASLRGRAQGLSFVFAVSYAVFLTFYVLSTLGRGWDMGYGPRYTLPCVLPMAVGGGVLLADMGCAARRRGSSRRALDVGGPAAVALAAIGIGVVRLAPMVYPYVSAEVHVHNLLTEALARAPLHQAVVFGGYGFNNTDPKDLAEDLPLDLYPDQDVLVAVDGDPTQVRCVREQYPTRHLWRAVPGAPVGFVPYDNP